MAARDKTRRSTQEGADSLFLPTEQIKGIMQNKDKFVVTNLRSQHFYFMKKKLSELSSNNRNDSIIKRSQDSLNSKNIHKGTNNSSSNSSSNPNNSYLLLTSLISQKKAASLQHNQSQGEISKYRLEPGGYCPSRSIEEMLDQVGYDIRSHECQPQILRSEQNALKKRTFFNSNRGMDLFEDASPFVFSSNKYLVKHKKQGQYSRLIPADSQVISSVNRSMEEMQTHKAFKNSQKIQQPQPNSHNISQFSLPKQSLSSLMINHNTSSINNTNNSNHLPALPIFKTKKIAQQSSGSLSHKRNRSSIKNERKSDLSSLLFTEGDDYFFENNPQPPVSSSILADFSKGLQLPPISSNPITIQQHQPPQHYNNHKQLN